MNEYLVELYLPRGDASSLAAGGPGLDVGGPSIRRVRSIVVPEDETCYLLCEAESVEAVRDAAQRAGLRFERVVRVAPEASVA
jgi:hypothetical protein